jgi:hypothetical protein
VVGAAVRLARMSEYALVMLLLGALLAVVLVILIETPSGW